tara:strand:+ start:333 stop:458 length:126 start_codon:yes stop_codon:yes gene_type:complete
MIDKGKETVTGLQKLSNKPKRPPPPPRTKQYFVLKAKKKSK